MTDRQLQDALKSMSMKCFVKYYRQFCDLSLSLEDIFQLMVDNCEPWGMTKLDRARTGRRIIQRGRAEDALTRIVGSKASLQTRRQAEQYLDEI